MTTDNRLEKTKELSEALLSVLDKMMPPEFPPSVQAAALADLLARVMAASEFPIAMATGLVTQLHAHYVQKLNRIMAAEEGLE